MMKQFGLYIFNRLKKHKFSSVAHHNSADVTPSGLWPVSKPSIPTAFA